MLAREIMTSDPSVVTPDEPISRAAEIMRDLGVGIVPVVDDPRAMRLIGVITDRDITIRCVARKHAPECLVRAHMTVSPLSTVSPTDDVDRVISLMEHEQVRRIPVVSGGNRLEGIIAQADLATKLGPTQPLKIEEVLEHVSTAAASTS